MTASQQALVDADDKDIGTLTEDSCNLIYRGLKFVEADILKFKASAEARGFAHTVSEVNQKLKLLHGNGIEPGLFARFAPQIDAFSAGALDGKGGSDAGGQLSLASDTPARSAPPEKGERLIFPDNSAGVIDHASALDDSRRFRVWWRPENEVPPEVGEEELPLLEAVAVFDNSEWRSAEDVEAGEYQKRDEVLLAAAHERVSADDAEAGAGSVTDIDVPVNTELEQGSADKLVAQFGTEVKTTPAKKTRAPRASKNGLHHKDAFKPAGEKKGKPDRKAAGKGKRKH